MVGDRLAGIAAAPRGSSSEPMQAAGDPEGEPEADVLQQEPPPHEIAGVGVERRGEGQHGREREPVVEARLEVQRMADHARDTRVGDDRPRTAPGSVGESSAPSKPDSVQFSPTSAWASERDDHRA